MHWTNTLILLILWTIGLIGDKALGSWMFFFLLVAAILLIIDLLSDRRAR